MCVKTRYLGFISLVLGLLPIMAQAVPDIQRWSTSNGSEIYFARTEGLPLLDVRVIFDAGSARDGDQYGLAALTANVLDTGAAEWDADAIAQRLDGLGAQLNTAIARDHASISLRTLTQPDILQPTLETAKAVISRPRFSESDFKREQQNVLLALKQREESPADLAAIRFFELIYGDHPYAHPKEGYITQVTALKQEDLLHFYQRYYVARNAKVILVGDIDRPQAEQIAAMLVSGLAEGVVPESLPAVQPLASAKVIREVFPSEQTHIYSGVPGIKVGDPDYFPLYVGNHILGGSGLVSRISEEVREKRGLSYSAYSYFYPFRELGPFMMGLQTRNDQADEALEVLQRTLVDFIANGPDAKSLEASKKNITGGFVMRLDSNRKLLDQIAHMAFYHLPLDYLAQFTEQVERVSLSQIRDAWQRRIDPSHLQTVLVGAKSAK